MRTDRRVRRELRQRRNGFRLESVEETLKIGRMSQATVVTAKTFVVLFEKRHDENNLVYRGLAANQVSSSPTLRRLAECDVFGCCMCLSQFETMLLEAC